MHPAVGRKSARFTAHKGVFQRLSRILASLFVLTVMLTGYMLWRMHYAPATLDTSTTHTTVNGLYQVSYVPSSSPIPINRLHTWTLTLTTPDGRPVKGAHITVDGDMPQHGHGLPTQPHVTRELESGQYLVEGIKFQMGGWWVVDFDISAENGEDNVRFHLLLTK